METKTYSHVTTENLVITSISLQWRNQEIVFHLDQVDGIK
jgi:hypothetical protein